MRPPLHLLSALAFAPLVAALAFSAQAQSSTPLPAEAYRQDAQSLSNLIEMKYAYLERLPDGRFPMSPELAAQAEAVHDAASLLRYAENALTALADHHAITGSSFADSWAVVPSYGDLWVEQSGREWVISDVRDASPAAEAGVRPGDRLVAVEDQSVDDAVAAFWRKIGLGVEGDRAAYALRVLIAGRRDRPRVLTVQGADGVARRLTLSNLYAVRRDQPAVETRQTDDALIIRINDALGDHATIADFDQAMGFASPGQTVIIDLTETPSGGNTMVARAIMGWFVDAPSSYQIHTLPVEARETGIERRWIEQVLPRPGKHHDGPVVVRVGRWTGSMGEGLAIGLQAQGARVVGRPMAGLLGAIYDLRLPNSGLVVKIPVERLYAVDGTPRERFRPEPE